MSARQLRAQQAGPGDQLSRQFAALVDALVEQVAARVVELTPVRIQAARAAYSVKEFAALFGVNPETVRREIVAENLAAEKFGGEYRIPHSEVERWTARANERRSA